MKKSIGDPDPSHSMSQLASLIWRNENLYGPIAEIGNDGAHTVIVLDRGKPAPVATDATVHVALVAAGAAKPAGATVKLCSGEAFLRSAKTQVDVYRC